MPESIQEERLRWVLPIVNKDIKLKDLVKVCPYSRRTLIRWCQAYRQGGMSALVPKTTTPNTQPNETPIREKEEVIALRKSTGLCALKLHWRLAKQGLVVPVRTIGKILKDEGLVRKYRTKRVKYKYLKAKRQPGELVEIDVKYVPGEVAGHRYFQYTAIDVASRWRHLEIYDAQSTSSSIVFLQTVMERFPYQILAIKTDNHPTFTNYYLGTNQRSDLRIKTIHALDRFCALKVLPTISLILVNQLRMGRLREVIVRMRRRSTSPTASPARDHSRERSDSGITTTTTLNTAD